MCKEVEQSTPPQEEKPPEPVAPVQQEDDDIFREWPVPDATPPPPNETVYKTPKISHKEGEQSSNDELSNGLSAVKNYFPDGQDSSIDEQLDILPIK